MKIALVVIGKTDAGYFVEAINEYKNRLSLWSAVRMDSVKRCIKPLRKRFH